MTRRHGGVTEGVLYDGPVGKTLWRCYRCYRVLQGCVGWFRLGFRTTDRWAMRSGGVTDITG